LEAIRRYIENNPAMWSLDIDNFSVPLSLATRREMLARHYGFTDQELDFIINYDIKYRLGRDAGEEEEEE
jgi:hypothetical protein